jgi:hypothetical protein
MAEQRADAPIVIINPDADFSATVAGHVRDELDLTSIMVSNKDEAKQYLDGALAVISPEEMEDGLPCPVVLVRQKPLKLQDLLDDIARIRHNHGSGELKLSEAYSLQWRQKQLLHCASGKAVALTDKEASLLQYLAEAKGQGVPRDQLLKHVWGLGEAVDTHTLETHIYRLRGKFRELCGDDAMIAATEGGYKLAIE